MTFDIDLIVKELSSIAEQITKESISENNISEDKKKKNQNVKTFWNKFTQLFPADIAYALENINEKFIYNIFFLLSPELKADVFMEFSEDRRKYIFLNANLEERELILNRLEIHEVVDFFDDLSDEEVDTYITFLKKQERKKVRSLLEFPETSAAGIMDSDVFVLTEEINVSKTIQILQRLKPEKSLYKTIYVVNKKNEIIGSFSLEDLVLHSPSTIVSVFMKKVDFKIPAIMDQQDVANYMVRYHVDILPVIDEKETFIGVVTSKNLTKVLEHEASEDILHMASMKHIEDNYFEISFSNLLKQRIGILIFLLLIQSISATIINYYQSIVAGFLIAYIGLITSTGGNIGSQVSALVIQGLASGDLKTNHMSRFARREILISGIIGLCLSAVSFLRIYLFSKNALESLIISISLFFIVIISTVFGALTPFILRKLSVDPAYSAGPILSTCMDIIGVIIFITISFYGIKMLI
jgi:magnesium transporter